MLSHMELRTKVATCVRMMAMERMIDFNGHVSVRVPAEERGAGPASDGMPSRFLINARYSSRVALTAKDVVMIDEDGHLVEGEAEPPSESPLHLAVYKARPDVGSVAHLHPYYATVVTIAGAPFKPVYIVASEFGPEGVPVFDNPGLIRKMEQGEAVARALGPRQAVLLRAHGAVTVSTDVEGAFAVAVALEENARTMLWASSLGTPRPLSPEEMKAYGAPVSSRGTKYKMWDFYSEKARVSGWLNGLD